MQPMLHSPLCAVPYRLCVGREMRLPRVCFIALSAIVLCACIGSGEHVKQGEYPVPCGVEDHPRSLGHSPRSMGGIGESLSIDSLYISSET